MGAVLASSPAALQLCQFAVMAGNPSREQENLPVHLFLPLASSILYVMAALLLKQAAARGVGVWRIGLVCNAITAAAFLLLWPLGGTFPGLDYLWQPAVVAVLFVGGQLCSFLALEKGDVSLATPVLGAKVVLVALFTTWMTAESVGPALWGAAGLSCLGIALLNRRAARSPHDQVPMTICLALLAAAAYALFDVLVMKWAPGWGSGRFLPVSMLLTGALSFLFVPLFREPITRLRAADWRVLSLGGMLLALQAVILITTLAKFGDATAVNVIYSMRGLWSVAAVWFLGHWFGNRERAIGGESMRWRLIGAALLSAAVVLVFV
jgi:drug/metabolite transporter (DMT)-like permease